MSASTLRKRPVHPYSIQAPDLLNELGRANRMLTIAAQERKLLRSALQDFISLTEELRRYFPEDPWFQPGGRASISVRHARELLRPKGEAVITKNPA